ncbi:hypothetical protein OPV22_017106 [Ensete ventricosum]|uniref:6,7-dimethyl-8-ribityllumazine synthase n=2 Tax=Ensete ventricosum TaxID=4639 RepID=A0AAV8QSB6_ENSVE|nr:hypothetical protein OPV22_017106 [Ensete ventricosum]
MGNSLRCCLACVLPCGALDVVRVVHLSGQVEEYSRHVTAGEILAANPDHVISKPCSSQGVVRRILIVSPESELKRGHIYFLIPTSTLPDRKKTSDDKRKKHAENTRTTEILPEKKQPSHRRRHRSGRVGVWRPHLERICEDS